MSAENSAYSAADRHCLFEACTRQAQALGGDESTVEYFFNRAESSRLWVSAQGAVTIADMDIADWCAAIAWSAPGIGRPQKQTASSTERETPSVAAADQTTTSQSTSPAPIKGDPPRKQPRSGARARGTAPGAE